MNLPEGFLKKIEGAFGEAGSKWLDGISAQINEYEEKWGIQVLEPVSNLYYNFVAKAKDVNGNPLILKLGVPGFDFSNEMRTIQMYEGEGCAKLIMEDAENGAMLLEHLTPGINLSALEDEEEVTDKYIQIWKAIRRKLPENAETPAIMNWARGLERYKARFSKEDAPVPFKAVERAMAIFDELHDPEKQELLHGDLHHENILYSQGRGWLAIDPKGVAGDPYFDIVSFLINHLFEKNDPRGLLRRRIDLICEALRLDRERLLKASIALGTLYACWGIEDQAEWEETYTCVVWFEEFLIEGHGKNHQA